MARVFVSLLEMSYGITLIIKKVLLLSVGLVVCSLVCLTGDAAQKVIEGVPHYDQDLFPIDREYGRSSGIERGDCVPVAVAMLHGYYDSQGWSRLIPYGDSSVEKNAWGVDTVVRKYKEDVKYKESGIFSDEGSTQGVYFANQAWLVGLRLGEKIEAGVRYYEPNANFTSEDDDIVYWERMQEYINADRPCVVTMSPVLFIIRPQYINSWEPGVTHTLKGGHAVTAKGWSDVGGRWMIANMGWNVGGQVWFNYDGKYNASAGDWYISQVAPGGTPSGQDDDAYEDNDKSGSAHLISSGTISDLRCMDTLLMSGSYKSSLGDWYEVTTSAGKSLSVSINFSNANGNIDLRVYDVFFDQVGFSGSNSNQEKVEVDNTESGSYLIYVYGRDNAQNDNYSLTVSLSDPPQSDYSLIATNGDYDDKIRLNWEDIGPSYEIYRSLANNFGSSYIRATTNNPYYTDYGLGSGQTYYYWVKASNQSGAVSNVAQGATSEDLSEATGMQVSLASNEVPLDRISYATLTATVRDASGNPLAGRIVKFNMPATTPGGWWDPVRNQTLYNPVSVVTNSQGRAVAHHMPTELGDVDLVVSSGSTSKQVSYESIADPGITVALNVSLIRRLEGSQTYDVEGNFTYSNGDGIADGTVRFSSTLGKFENGQSSIDLTRLGHGGKSTTLTVQENGTATITATYLPSGSSATQNVVVQLGDVPQMNAAFTLTSPRGGLWKALDRGYRYLAILESGKGMAFYDTHTLLLDSYIDADFDSDKDDWLNARYMTFSGNDNAVVAADDEDVAILYRTLESDAFYVTRSFNYHPEDNIDLHPQGTKWAAVTGEDNGDINLDIYTMSGGRERVLKRYPSGVIHGLAFSPDGSRLAATVRDKSYRPDRTAVLIWNTSNWSLLNDIEVNRGSRPEGVAFSPDSSLLAVSTGDQSLLLLDKNGGAASLPYTQIAFRKDPVDIEFSPDGQYLAAHTDGGSVSIIQVATSLELLSLNGVPGNSQYYDTMAWSGDGRFVFAISQGGRDVSVFAPFDTQDPIISTSEDHAGKVVSEPNLTITGTASDDVMIRPNGLRYRINDGGWSNISLSSSGAFKVDAVLQGGTNDIVIEATDVAGRSTTLEQSVVYPVPAVFQFTALNGEIELDFAVETIYPGDVFSAEAIPNSGYQFLQWGGSIPADLSQQNPVTLVATQPMDMVALFGPRHYGILTSAIDGSISLDPQLDSYESGTSVTATASPDTGYSFSGWVVNGVESDTAGSQITLIVDQGIVLEAVFEPHQYSVNFVVDEHGVVVSGDLSQTVSHGARAAPPLIDAIPGWYFLGWSADTSQVFGDITVTARFEQLNRPPVLDTIGDISVNTGTEIHFTATASDPDLPAQTLTFALAGAPTGASIESSSGYFSWIPNQEQAVGVFTFSVQVSDGTLVDAEEININFDPTLVITEQPQAQSVQLGATVEFSVSALGEGAMNYQWRKDGEPILNATASTLVLIDVQLADSGDYDVVVSDSEESLSSDTATLSVSQLSQTITFDGLIDRTYGDAPITLNAISSCGLPVSFTVESGPATLDGNELTLTGVGEVMVRASQAGNDTYLAAVPVDRSFNVGKATGTVTLGNLSATYDGNPHAASATTSPDGLTVNLTYDGGSTAPIDAGSYAVVGTIDDTNYQGTTTGTLIIAKANPVLTWIVPASITYGTPLSATQLAATANVPGTFVYSPSAGEVLSAGDHTLSVTFTPNDTTNYTTPTTNQNMTVSKAPLTITAADQTKTQGDPNPVLTMNYDGFVNGDTAADIVAPEITTSATTDSPDGSYPIIISGGSAANYYFVLQNGTLTIEEPVVSDLIEVANYPFNGSLEDIKGGRNGASVGGDVSYVDGLFGTALNMPNIWEHRVPVTVYPFATESFLVSAWVRMEDESSWLHNANGALLQAIILTYQTGDFQHGFVLGLKPSSSTAPVKVYSYYKPLGNKEKDVVSSDLANPYDRWIHIAVGVDVTNEKQRLYIDGDLVDEGPVATASFFANEGFIGSYKYSSARNDNPQHVSSGIKIDSLRLFTGIASTADIQALFKAGNTGAGLEAWRHKHFTNEEVADLNLSSPTADPDGDGLSNLVEYALGLEPKTSDTTGLPELTTTETHWVYTYSRPTDRTDIGFEVEISTDLSSWSTTGVTHELLSSTDGIETWQATYPLSSATNVFFRLKVTKQ